MSRRGGSSSSATDTRRARAMPTSRGAGTASLVRPPPAAAGRSPVVRGRGPAGLGPRSRGIEDVCAPVGAAAGGVPGRPVRILAGAGPEGRLACAAITVGGDVPRGTRGGAVDWLRSSGSVVDRSVAVAGCPRAVQHPSDRAVLSGWGPSSAQEGRMVGRMNAGRVPVATRREHRQGAPPGGRHPDGTGFEPLVRSSRSMFHVEHRRTRAGRRPAVGSPP